jgi:hypothetical protein
MKSILRFLIVLCVGFILQYCSHPSHYQLKSPSGKIAVNLSLTSNGEIRYDVKYNQKNLIDASSMAFDFLDQPGMKDNLKIVSHETKSYDESWEMPWGEDRFVENRYNELLVRLEETSSLKRMLNVYFRAYDDGIGFRYEFPEQERVDSLVITDENTEFRLTGDHTAWWIPGDWDIYEHLYNTTLVSEINALEKRNHPNLAQTYIPENAVNTPVTMRTSDGLHLSFHEAALTDYAGMTLKVDTANLVLMSELVGSTRYGYKVKRALPFTTPWRTIQIAEKAGDLITSKLILNLNEPNKLGDISWFSPMKYVGIWWEMHVGKSTWDYGMTQDMGTYVKDGRPHGRHGATTENAKRYIDFASENNIRGLLVEGWNTGWEHWIGFEDREGVFDFITPYPDYNLGEVARYAREKNVEIIMHHETSAAPRTYEAQLDTAFALMKHYGMHAVKTGYVGKIIPKGEHHHGQWMVNHYRKVIETAAKYQVAVNAHEPIKATGIRRTYPNAIAREGLRGQEFNAWASDGGNPPEHLPIVAFTRMLAGPIDFTPGVFDIEITGKPDNRVNTTLAQQLALYVVIYGPVQMACDLPENYEGNPAFQFIRDVGVDWEQSIVLNGEVGDYVTIAREEKGTENWFLGSITDENARDLTVSLSFLDEDVSYEAVIYRDGQDAHWKENPQEIVIESMDVNMDTELKIPLAAGGGFAASFIKK